MHEYTYVQTCVLVYMSNWQFLRPEPIEGDPAHAHGACVVPAAEHLLHLVGGDVEAGALSPDVAVVAGDGSSCHHLGRKQLNQDLD